MTVFINEYNNIKDTLNDALSPRIRVKLYLFIVVAFIFGLIFGTMDIRHFNTLVYKPKMTVFDGMHMSIITLATVGYGDIYPVTLYARSLIYLEILLGMIIIFV